MILLFDDYYCYDYDSWILALEKVLTLDHWLLSFFGSTSKWIYFSVMPPRGTGIPTAICKSQRFIDRVGAGLEVYLRAFGLQDTVKGVSPSI